MFLIKKNDTQSTNFTFFKMKKISVIIKNNFVIYFFLISLALTPAKSSEKSTKEIKLGIFLDDLKQIGNFKEIKYSPIGMFDENKIGFHKKQLISQKEFIKTFIDQKGLMEKYTDRVILGMAHFEYFYMQQLKEKKKSIKTFKTNYPNINAATKKNLKQLYGLSKAKKSMREAIGLTLTESPEVAIKTYYTLYKLLNQAKITQNKLSKEEKSFIKIHNKISKKISNLEKLADDKINMRLTDKKFNKEYGKIFKNLSKELKKSKDIKDFELLSSFVLEIDKYRDTDLSSVSSGYKISKFVLQNIKKDKITKKFEQDLSDANFDNFDQDELQILGNITSSMKANKNSKSNDIQLQILNLENTGIPVNKLLNVYRDDLELKLDTINLQVTSASTMKDWKLSDWANAWKNPIPKTIINDTGIEISLSADEIESIKAQLAMKNFKEILNLDDFNNIIEDNKESFSDIENNLNLDTQAFEFSFTLDDFARSLGDSYGLDINDYSDLTDLANATHGANWSVEEYASVFQGNVDIINALQSGSLSSFDAGQISAAASSSLQEVADTIKAAADAGVSVDLESTAQGMGYGSFAEAVADYNARNGTNYTEAEAREALGQ